MTDLTDLCERLEMHATKVFGTDSDMAKDLREAAARLRAVHELASHGLSLPAGPSKAACALVMDAAVK